MALGRARMLQMANGAFVWESHEAESVDCFNSAGSLFSWGV